MIFNRPKLYPNLEEYLHTNKFKFTHTEVVLGWVAGAILTFATMVPAFIVLNAARGAAVSVAAIAAGTWMILRAMRAARQRLPFAQQEGLQIRRQLKDAVENGSINHVIPASVGAVLDECVLGARRIELALSGHIWQDPALPAHWVSVRDNAMRAREASIDEVFALAGPHVSESGKNRPIRSLQDLMQRIAGTEEIPMMPLPPSFRPALDIADRLRTVALELETASAEVAQESTLRGNMLATSRLDSVLGEIRGLQSAEEELHQDR